MPMTVLKIRAVIIFVKSPILVLENLELSVYLDKEGL